MATDHARDRAEYVCQVLSITESRRGDVVLEVWWRFRRGDDDVLAVDVVFCDKEFGTYSDLLLKAEPKELSIFCPDNIADS